MRETDHVFGHVSGMIMSRSADQAFLRAHLLAVIQVLHVAAEHRLPPGSRNRRGLIPTACLSASIRQASD
jgi:hypothetical protein